MFKTRESVGKVGRNRTTDLAKIQLALYALKYLKESDFLEELFSSNSVSKSNLISPFLSFSDKLKELPKGQKRHSDSQLTATIAAIVNFQKEVVKRRPFDGRIDANGRSFGFLLRAVKKLPPPQVIPDSHDSGSTGGRINENTEVQKVGKSIVIKISADGKTESKKILIEASRKYIFDNYNWNGIVKLMKFAYEKNGDKYICPHQLAGTNDDNSRIITDDGILYIIQLQLKRKKKIMPPKRNNLLKILKSVDGKPGLGFLGNIIKKSREIFYNEKDNKSLKDANNNTIAIPSMKDKEGTLYDFFRKIVIARNGLWSDNQGVTNLIGLRRNIDRRSSTAYNDSLVACWKDQAGNSRVEINIATTEPGYKNRYRQIAPQTISAVFGFHHGRQPSGRTRKVIAQNAGNGSYVWEKADKGFNFHQGSNSFIFPYNGWLEPYGIKDNERTGNPSSRFSLQQLFELNITLSEIYYLLSQFGTNGETAPYQNLKDMAESKPMKIDKIENGVVTISQKGRRQTRKIVLADAKMWMINRWHDKRFSDSNRAKISAILSDASGMTKSEMKKLVHLNRSEVAEKIKDEYVIKVIERQFQFYPRLTDIDAKAGPDYYRTIVGIRPSKDQAKEVFPRVNKLIDKLKKLPLKNVSKLQKKLKTGLRINTNFHRENVRKNTRYDELKKVDFIANVTVKGSSAGCQVIYDTEVFYDFWLKLLKRAEKSKQRKWYYTLIDATSWKKTDVV